MAAFVFLLGPQNLMLLVELWSRSIRILEVFSELLQPRKVLHVAFLPHLDALAPFLAVLIRLAACRFPGAFSENLISL